MSKGISIVSAPPLSQLTTIRLGGNPIARVVVEEPGGFDRLPAALERLGGRPVVLGRGSNILAHDGDVALVLVELGKSFLSHDITVLREEGDNVVFCADAAMPLPLLVSRMAAMGLNGLAGLSGIPGSLGGAVAMNAGSFGDEIKNCLTSVSLFSPMLGRVVLRAQDLNIDYRHFSLPQLEGVTGSSRNWFIIYGAEFRCTKSAPELLQARARECAAMKRQSQPMGAASAGCIFKNHEAGPAGKLLEEAGFKGHAKGGMSFSTVHANFMVNNGSGTSAQAFDLIDDARYAVQDHCGALLELEVKVWP